jgi:hypothetical protein
MFVTLNVVKKLLAEGQSLIIAADEKLLNELPRGNWIGGTIPYFMTDKGGCVSEDHLFVQPVSHLAVSSQARTYDKSTISRIGVDSPDNGYTILIMPPLTEVHAEYSLNAPSYPQLFIKVIAGWASGYRVDATEGVARVYDGRTGTMHTDKAVAMHVELPPSHRATLGIVNIFEPSDAVEIQFPATGFSTKDAVVNGVNCNFHDYLVECKHDIRLPLIADYCGALINIGFWPLDPIERKVTFGIPVLEGVTYRFSKPVANYVEKFAAAIPPHVEDPAFSCNCVFNYLYGELEGKHTGNLVGPMTFGEIGYQMLNQTLVYVMIQPV